MTAHIAIIADTTDEERGELLHRLKECTQEHFLVPIVHSTSQFEPQARSSYETLKHTDH
ncbi:hypothetical protein [Arcanobacterium phocae]|uniref:hypothetical protein n=1 Tax=Arcanobacterium phocae TaxID=131112 RepID=UPI001C0F178D|nr:hypothetical protein [Arcanobacterium phocae]